MRFYLAAAFVTLHCLFWGVGLAWLAAPGVWRRYWLLLVPVCGWTLQATVVWMGIFLGAKGTDSYALAAQLVPLALLVVAWRQGMSRHFRKPLEAAWPAYAIFAAVSAVLLLPLALASERLTTQSWGSCDAADYAAGARVFQEFARGETLGFLGLQDVVRTGSTVNFHEFWVRLNHFSPSAILALNNSVFGFQLHESVGLVTVLFVGTLAMPAWLVARLALRLGNGASAAVAAVSAGGPVMAYAVAHVATAQVLGAQGVALLVTAALGLWRLRSLSVGPFVLWFIIAFSVLLGAYNFILLVSFAPVAGVILLEIGTPGWLKRVMRLAAVCGAAFVCSTVLWWERVAGIVERMQLFQQTDFGWKIPILTLDGILGLASGITLEGYSPVVQLGVSALLVILLAIALVRSTTTSRTWVAAAAVGPVLLGYGVLQVRAVVEGSNASYDAYKILAVFLPVVAGALLAGFSVFNNRIQKWVLVAIVVTLAGQLADFVVKFRKAPFMVTSDVAALRSLEDRAEISGINMRIEDFWTRLWANAFLLRKPQYFSITTYEGRNRTELRGSHDLWHAVLSPAGDRIGGADGGWPAPAEWASDLAKPQKPRNRAPFTLLRASSLDLSWERGWHGLEGNPRSGTSWRWMSRKAEVTSTAPKPFVGEFLLRLKAFRKDTLHIESPEGWTGKIELEPGIHDYRITGVAVPPGVVRWRLRTELPPEPLSRDPRELAVAILRWEWRLPDGFTVDDPSTKAQRN